MAPKSLSLSRATAADIPEIAALQYRCFPPRIRELFMGCRTEADLPRLAEQYARLAAAAPSRYVWTKVAVPSGDKDGACKGREKIIAASNWKVVGGGSGVDSLGDDEAPGWLDGDAREEAARMLREMNEARRRANPGGFVHLHICFTDPDYRRLGAGGMMMQWGCDLADRLGLPAWVEASPQGSALYRRYGFYDFEPAKGGLAGTNMKRDARHGGKEG
ncbi:hypothetical protein F4810DRAFT_674884 [Camillea tinctor]|nr:hypothetical protein F4810DRAFT_674884 [Camillea tinctor]